MYNIYVIKNCRTPVKEIDEVLPMFISRKIQSFQNVYSS